MSFAVTVKHDKRSVLQATTHVDGTARIQIVYEDVNPRFWRLIAEFHKLTGVPVVLNTSFNNNAEPIVDSVDDAIQCFMTTGLDYLVVDDYLIAKKQRSIGVREWMVISQPRTTHLIRRAGRGQGADGHGHALRKTVADSRPVDISAEAFSLLARSDGRTTIGDVLGGAALNGSLADELLKLWQRRLIRVDARPPRTDAR
jgi:hypothetical protein